MIPPFGKDHPINVNPFEAQFNQCDLKARRLSKKLSAIKDELEWYQNTNIQVLTREISSLEFEITESITTLKHIDKEIEKVGARLEKALSAKIKIWEPWRWLSQEQRQLRKHINKLEKTSLSLDSIKETIQLHQDTCLTKKKSLVDLTNRYQQFDFPAVHRRYEDCKAELETVNQELQELKDKSDKFNEKTLPLDREILRLEREIQTWQDRLVYARKCEVALAHAATRYERKLIHEECEQEFGHGSPRRAIITSERKLKTYRRNLSKLQKRKNSIYKNVSRKISHLVIDGNNLCYENSNFIGLEALQALLKELSSFPITVIFDSSIRRLLRQDDHHIRGQLGKSIEVHVVATNKTADETILNLAEKENTVYIISNDRFAEFVEKKAVRENRIIRHEIVGGQVQIADLDISVPFKRYSPL